MSFKFLKKLALVQFVISIFVMVFAIIFITLLAIRVDGEQKYQIPGYVFLGLFALVLSCNVVLTILINLKINKIEKHSQVKFDGWFYLYGGCLFCWLSYFLQNSLYKLSQSIMDDESIKESALE